MAIATWGLAGILGIGGATLLARRIMFGRKPKTISSLTEKLPREELVRRSRILIVDDEQPDLLIENLKKSRFAVDYEVDINRDNIGIIERSTYDLVLLDFGSVGRQFGRDEGLSLLKHIKRVNPSIIVLTYTSKALGTEHAEFYRLADGVLGKDAGITESMERIEEALKRAHSLDNVWKSLLRLCDIKAGSEDDRKLQDLLVRGLSNKRKFESLKSKIKTIVTSKPSQEIALAMLKKAFELGVNYYTGA